MKDTGGEVKTLRALSPQSDSGGSAVNGVDMDRTGFNSAVMQIISGAISGSPTATSMAIKVQVAPDDGAGSPGTYTDKAGATATITAADTLAEINLDLRADEKWVRVTETTTFTGGTSPAALVGAVMTLGQAKDKPA